MGDDRSAYEAEKATAAKSEAPIPGQWAQDKAGCGCEVETSPRDGKQELKALLQDRGCRPKKLPQKGSREPV